jgi:ABC-type Co2+ transport system permease subunit
MQSVVINFSNVSVSVALIFGGVFLLWQGYTTNIENMRNTGVILIAGGVIFYVLLLEYYGKRDY